MRVGNMSGQGVGDNYGLGGAPRWIVASLGAYSIVNLFALYLCTAAGQPFSIQGPSDSTSALSVTAMAGVGLWLSLVVVRSFPAGAPLRPAWMLFTLAAAAQAVSGALAQLLGSDWVLNPLLWAGHAQPGLTRHIRLAALIAGGPVRLALLAAAMLAVLRIVRKFGLWARPSATDWTVCGIVCLFALSRFAETGAASLTGGQIGTQVGMEDWTSLAGMPFLCVLFVEAMLLRQSVVHMGNGLIARCWAAFVAGIFLTGLAELAIWLIPHYSRAPLAIVESLARFLIATVFALAPAYQLAAQRRATKPASSWPENLATAVPAVAR
jgi:hypothetical protein